MSKPNERWCHFFGIFYKASPLLMVLSSKWHNFFSIWSLLSLEKYVAQKFSLLSVYQIFWGSFSVSHPLLPFPPKLNLFCIKLHLLVSNKQAKKKNPKIWNAWVFKMLFHPLVVLKAPNLKELWLFDFKPTPMMKKMEDFLIFPKKQ